jgi:hypothetical protein
MMRGQATGPATTFYAALTGIRALRRDPQRAAAGAVLERVEALQASLAGWAGHGPAVSIGAKHWLVQAELARYRRDRRKRPPATSARSRPRRRGLRQHPGAGQRACGECWLEQGQPRVAAVYLHDAVARYRQWARRPRWRNWRAHGDLLARAAGRAAQSRFGSATHGSTPSRMAGNAALDPVSLLKAAQALSNETGLRDVLQRLIAIVRENSGAQWRACAVRGCGVAAGGRHFRAPTPPCCRDAGSTSMAAPTRSFRCRCCAT